MKGDKVIHSSSGIHPQSGEAYRRIIRITKKAVPDGAGNAIARDLTTVGSGYR